MTITPRITVSAIEFIRSKDGGEEKEIVCVPLDVCRYLLSVGLYGETRVPDHAMYDDDDALTILRQEAEK